MHRCEMPADGSGYIKWDVLHLVVDKLEKGGEVVEQVWGGLCGIAETERCGNPATQTVICKADPEVIATARDWCHVIGCGRHYLCDICLDKLWELACVRKQ